MIHRLFILLFMVFLLGLPALAKEKTTIIADADDWQKDFKKETLSLKGNVNVIFNQQHLLCDKATVYEKTSQIVAEGNVILQNARTTLRGKKLELNYETGLGTLYGGVVTSGQVLIEAEKIEKVGEQDYLADDAYYTACLTCPASWGFTSTRVTAEIGGYAYINRPWLHLLQVPVLPLPYLVVPLSSRRQTGFLIPKPFSNNDGGLAIELPFFWAIDRSHDATISFINYEKRGQQLVGNYRFMVNPTSSGYFNAAYLDDNTITEDSLRGRWFVEYKHHYDLPEDYTQRTHLAIASDRRYGLDFFQHFNYNGQAALDNQVSLSKRNEQSSWSVETSYYISQLEEPFSLGDTGDLHRMPEFNYNLMDQKISDDYNVFFSFDFQYLNVARGDLAFEHTRSGGACNLDSGNTTSAVCYPTELSNGDFVYGAPIDGAPTSELAYGDLIRTGQRIDMMPRVHAPFWIGDVIDVDPSIGFRYTQYALGVASDASQGYDAYPSRFYTQLDLSAKSYLSRVFQWNENRKIKHTITPHIDIRYIPTVHQSRHNFLGNRDGLRYFRELEPIDDTDTDWRNAGRGIQFDNRDRVIGRQLVQYGLTNKIVSRSSKETNNANGLSNLYERNLFFDVSQVFDLNDARRNGDNARPWNDIRATVLLEMGPFSQEIRSFYYPYHGQTRWEASSRYNFGHGNFLGVTYNKNYIFQQDMTVLAGSKQEITTLSTGLNFKYVYFHAEVNYDFTADISLNESVFPTWKVTADIFPPGSCWSLHLGVLKPLDGAITPIIDMQFQFGT